MTLQELREQNWDDNTLDKRRKEIAYLKSEGKGTIPLNDDEKLVNLYRKHRDEMRIDKAEDFADDMSALQAIQETKMTAEYFGIDDYKLAAKIAHRHFSQHGGKNDTLAFAVDTIKAAWDIPLADLILTKAVLTKMQLPVSNKVEISISVQQEYQRNQKRKAITDALMTFEGRYLSRDYAEKIAELLLSISI